MSPRWKWFSSEDWLIIIEEHIVKKVFSTYHTMAIYQKDTSELMYMTKEIEGEFSSLYDTWITEIPEIPMILDPLEFTLCMIFTSIINNINIATKDEKFLAAIYRYRILKTKQESVTISESMKALLRLVLSQHPGDPVYREIEELINSNIKTMK